MADRAETFVSATASLEKSASGYTGEIWIMGRPCLATLAKHGDTVQLTVAQHPVLWCDLVDELEAAP